MKSSVVPESIAWLRLLDEDVRSRNQSLDFGKLSKRTGESSIMDQSVNTAYNVNSQKVDKMFRCLLS